MYIGVKSKGALIRCTNVCEIPLEFKNKEIQEMAIYHCSISIGSRGQGSSSIASCAYREGSKIVDLRTGVTHDYSRKKDVIESCILSPDNAPDFCKSSSLLWNEVERTEKRKDAQLFREVTVALPREQTHKQNRELVFQFCRENFVSKGMVAGISFHSSKTENPHAHIMLTMRKLNEQGFGQKAREWNGKALLNEWRENWAKSLNKSLDLNQINERVDHRALKEQGIERTPQIHIGYAAMEMEKRGEVSERGERNREILMENNQIIDVVGQGIESVRSSFEAYKRERERIKVEIQAAEKAKQVQIQKEREQQKDRDIGMSR